MSVLSRRAQHDATRLATETALLNATVELLGEGTAFAEIGIEQIVRRAGFSRPTFYSYFRDKRELILRLGGTLQADVAEVADPWLTGAEDATRGTLAAVLTAFARHRAVLRAILEAATYDPEVRSFWRDFHTRFVDIAGARIHAAHPELDARHVQARAYVLVLVTERAMTEHLAEASVDSDALLDELARLWGDAGTRTS